MSNIPVIVQHSGHWDETTNYTAFKVIGLLIPPNCDYPKLLGMICNELHSKTESTTMIIEYQSKERYLPFKILDDLHVMFYQELKKNELEFTNIFCVSPLTTRFSKNQRQASTSVIADVIKHKFTDIKTKYNVVDIIRDMKHDYNAKIKYNKAWRSKQKAKEIMRGNVTQSFADLYSYLYMLYTSNIRFISELQLTQTNCFLYVFVALNFSIKGWSYHIPMVVVVDGTLLKSSYRGTQLVAATQDAGGKIFPLAFAVVDSENDLSWE